MTDIDSPTPTGAARRPAILVASVVGAVAGAVAGVAVNLLDTPEAPDPVDEVAITAPAALVPEPIAPAVDDRETLEAALAVAEAERSQLAGSLLALNRRAESIEGRLAELASRSVESGPLVDPEGALPSGEVGEIVVAGDGEDANEEETVDTLVAAGLDPQSAADIRARRDAFQLARLELVDQATREGWADSERFDEALSTLEERRPDLRDELGDDAYDRYLYEEGRDNRVGIAAVIAGSAASEAGIAPGDIVLSYAGERVFRSRDLQSATREGARGEYVQVSVLRDGEVVAVDLPRGPLGVTLDGMRRSPD